MSDIDNISTPATPGQERLASSGGDASTPAPSTTESVASFDSGIGRSGEDSGDTDGSYETESNNSDGSSTPEQADQAGVSDVQCSREDCAARVAEDLATISRLEEWVKLATGTRMDELFEQYVKENGLPHEGCICSQMKALEARAVELKEVCEFIEHEKEVLITQKREVSERMDDVSRLYLQVQVKEKALGETHAAIDIRMGKMDEMLGLANDSKAEITRKNQALDKRQEYIEKQTKKLEHSQETFKKQSELLTKLLRQQQDSQEKLDDREKTMKAQQMSLELRELDLKKREAILAHREQALRKHERDVQNHIDQYTRGEQEFKERMAQLMEQSMHTSIANMGLESAADKTEGANEEAPTSASHAPDAITSPQPSPSAAAPLPSSLIPP
ncbi:unnamed protein product [Aureobasidium uvarum]|uniref:Uncharacterized protein n=1 Tax=Aureobasidium uvarum TaxID=2773716 RepID=A0A9N8KPX2_9PEZI|nr:unnamed protein product [Aureobasidium uvarum]